MRRNWKVGDKFGEWTLLADTQKRDPQGYRVFLCGCSCGARMVDGGVMIFDDAGILNGATKAVQQSFPPEQIEVSTRGKWRVTFRGAQ